MSRQMYWNEEAHQFFPVDDVPQEPVKLTNADRIRSMSNEELANEILSWFNWLNAVEWDDNRILDWLKEEVKE